MQGNRVQYESSFQMIASEPLDNIAASEPEKRIQASMVKLS